MSISGPFSIVSGSPLSLVGMGASQVVTIRFRPTTWATTSASVSFAATGDSVSRTVTGSGGAATDTTAPTVAITSPTVNHTYTTTGRWGNRPG